MKVGHVMAWMDSDRRIALLLALATFALLWATAGDVGVTWDEPFYFVASETYVEWFKVLVGDAGHAFSAEVLDRYWAIYDEHPPLGKLLSGLVWTLARPFADDATAHRLGNMLLFGFLTALLYLMVSEVAGRAGGLAAVASLLAMPRVFFHAHLAALDVAVAVAWLATVYLFWKTRERTGWWWTLAVGVAFGLALATKIHAVFVPVVLFAWALLFDRRRHVLLRVAAMPCIGLPTFVAVWPRLWSAGAGVKWYVDFVTEKHVVGQYYLSRLYLNPPWHFPFVITLAVVPLAITLLYVLGAVRVARDGRQAATGWLFVFNALVLPLFFATGLTRVWDNDRMYMPSFPYLAALAGMGFAWLVEVVSRRTRLLSPAVVGGALAAACFAPPVAASARLHPHQLSYYSELVGGLRGAARLGLETTYYSETYASALPYINEHAAPGAAVWAQEFSQDVLYYYQLHGQLRPDLRIASRGSAPSVYDEGEIERDYTKIWDADLVLMQHRQSGFTSEVLAFMGTFTPIYSLDYRGVPLVSAYERERAAHPLGVALGEGIELVGYDLHGGLSLPPGDTVYLSLLWQATVPLERDYTVSVQLLDDRGRLRAQVDRYPADGTRPSSSWRAGEKIRDNYRLPIPSDAPPGRYRLLASMYLLATMERLPVRDGQGVFLGDGVPLGTITVVR